MAKSPKGRGVLPKHLPRIEEIIAPDVTCGCGAERHIIGEDVSERLDIVPAQFRVIVTRRPKYACRSCEAGIVQAPAKPRLIEGGKRWSRKFGPVVKVDRMMKVTIPNEETQEPLA